MLIGGGPPVDGVQSGPRPSYEALANWMTELIRITFDPELSNVSIDASTPAEETSPLGPWGFSNSTWPLSPLFM